MKTILIIILTLVQFPFIVEGWISFLLNLLIKFLLRHDFLFFFNFLFRRANFFCLVAFGYVEWCLLGSL